MIHVHADLHDTLVPVDSIQPHHRNNNNGDIDAIVESIQVNGVYRPIYVAADGVIIAGHHLYYAMVQLGADQVPVKRLDFPSTDTRATRILLADNQVASLAQRDDEVTVELLQELLRSEGGLMGTGYDETALLTLINEASKPLSFGDQGGSDVYPVTIYMGQDLYATWVDYSENFDSPTTALQELLEGRS